MFSFIKAFTPYLPGIPATGTLPYLGVRSAPYWTPFFGPPDPYLFGLRSAPFLAVCLLNATWSALG